MPPSDQQLPFTPQLPNRDQRFVPDSSSYDIKRGELANLHREICRLASQGLKNVDIAERLEITPVTVSNVLNSDLGKQQVQTLQRARDIDNIEVSKKYMEMQEPARLVLEEIMIEGSKEENRLRAAIHVAGIGGHTPIQKSIEAKTGLFSMQDIDEIAGRIDQRLEKNKEIKVQKDKDIEDAEIVD